MSEMIEVYDEMGNRVEVTREEYTEQMMTFARANWDNLEALRHLVMQMMQTGSFGEAHTVAERLCELSDGNVFDLYWRAASLAETGKFDEAAAEFASLQDDAAYPVDQARAAMGLARVRARQGNLGEAARLLEEAVDIDNTNPAPMNAYYGFHAEQGNAETALQKIKAIAKSTPTNAAPHRALAHVALRDGNKKGVASHATDAVTRATPEQMDEIIAEMSWVLSEAGLPDEVVRLIEPNVGHLRNAHTFLNLVQAYIELQRSADAKKLLEQLIQGAPPEMGPFLQSKLQEIQN